MMERRHIEESDHAAERSSNKKSWSEYPTDSAAAIRKHGCGKLQYAQAQKDACGQRTRQRKRERGVTSTCYSALFEHEHSDYRQRTRNRSTDCRMEPLRDRAEAFEPPA